MATNTSIAYYLAKDPIPEDRLCVNNAEEMAQVIVDYVYVAGLASTVGSSGISPQTNNQIAALTTRVEELEAQVQELESQVPDRRVAATNVSLPAEDSTQVLTWSPPFETTNYEVRVTLQGSTGHPGAYYGWRVIGTSQTTSSVQISFDNIGANTSFSAVVETLE
jgi:outer membrane murein-binding lipoprotein Lpp